MQLSELIYLSVKNVIYYDDDSFTYTSFLNGDWRNSADYGNSLNNVLTPINEAFTRLLTLDKIPHKIVQVEDNNGIVTLPADCGEVIGNGIFHNGRPYTNEIHQAGVNKISIVKDYYYRDRKTELEYKPVIHFWGVDGEHDVDLKAEYGISDNVCEYIVEYVEGKLLEQISPDEANMHITRSEAYFSGLPDVVSTFVQHVVQQDFRIGW